MPLNITTRNFSVDDITDDQTNEDENGVPQNSTNAGVALTNVQVDQNFINIKHLVDANAARIDVAHDSDGNIKNLSIDASDLSANSIDYGKIRSVHYVAEGNTGSTLTVGSNVNQMVITINDLTSLDAGMLFLVNALKTNTDSVTLTLNNVIDDQTTPLVTNKPVYKRKNQVLSEGDIVEGHMIALIYEGVAGGFQMINESSSVNIELVDLAPQEVGQLISFNSAKAPAIVPAGTVGQVLTAGAAGNPPTFQTQKAAASADIVSIGGVTAGAAAAHTAISFTAAEAANPTKAELIVVLNDMAESINHLRGVLRTAGLLT